MKSTIDIVRLGELENYMSSERWEHSDVVPMSSLRMKSYLKNPKAESEDVVMICAFEDVHSSGLALPSICSRTCLET